MFYGIRKLTNKICVLGDLHIGARKSSPNFMSLQERFFSFLFAELNERGIDTIVQLGDVFDSHANVNLNAIDFFQKKFIKVLAKKNIKLYTLVGNHDIAHKRSLSINAVDLLLKGNKNIHITNKPEQININGVECVMIPWICEENKEQVQQTVEMTTAKYCFGHFEFKDFYMYKGIKNEHGQDATSYSRFDLVLSGHYHHRNERGNVVYAGTGYELTWSDVNDPKGFTILDLDSGNMEYIQSPHTIFKKVYAASEEDAKAIAKDKSVKDHYVKLYLSCDIDKKATDHLKTSIESNGCYDLEIIDVRSTTLADMDDELDLETVELKDSKSILDMHIEKIESEIDRPPLKNLLYSLYTEAVDREEY